MKSLDFHGTLIIDTACVRTRVFKCSVRTDSNSESKRFFITILYFINCQDDEYGKLANKHSFDSPLIFYLCFTFDLRLSTFDLRLSFLGKLSSTFDFFSGKVYRVPEVLPGPDLRLLDHGKVYPLEKVEGLVYPGPSTICHS